VWPDGLDRAVADPVKRYLEIAKLLKTGKPPGRLRIDKPRDDPAVTGKPVAVDVRTPPLDRLAHDAAYRTAVKASPLHGRLLDRLAEYSR
jgi:hypothetical protein